jgi:hypothetical protein
MDLACLILWLALRGLVIAAAATIARLAWAALRWIVARARHDLAMRPQNVYYIA